METMIDSSVAKATGWTVHRVVIAVLATLAVGLSLLLWFHPTAGYAKGGFLDGMDLRADLIKLLWIHSVVFAGVSSLAVLATKSMRNRIAAYVLSYVVAAGALVPTFMIAEKFF